LPGVGGIAPPPEFAPRKSGAAIKSVHEAFDRALEQEEKLHAWKLEVASNYEKEFGRKLVIPAPVHALDAKAGTSPTIGAEQAHACANMLVALPGMLGFESRPAPEAVKEFASSLQVISKYYPNIDSKIFDHLMLAAAATACAAPYVGEYRAKKAGHWPELRAEYARQGMLREDAPALQGAQA
jgi:hypothetical protein